LFKTNIDNTLRDSSLFRWPLKLVQQSKQMLFPSENKAFFQRYLPACQGEDNEGSVSSYIIWGFIQNTFISD
uniref:Uncharacterized protein n=1 Tax=Gadus morhua TaxID=8049 RepID=A0A8C5CYH2_GADMO